MLNVKRQHQKILTDEHNLAIARRIIH